MHYYYQNYSCILANLEQLQHQLTLEMKVTNLNEANQTLRWMKKRFCIIKVWETRILNFLSNYSCIISKVQKRVEYAILRIAPNFSWNPFNINHSQKSKNQLIIYKPRIHYQSDTWDNLKKSNETFEKYCHQILISDYGKKHL